jgi:hypothetical protein
MNLVMEDTNVAKENNPIDPASAMAVVAPPAECIDLRTQKILEHLNNSLAKSDAFQATLGAANCDFLLLGYRLKQAIDEELEPGPAALADFEDMMPAIEMLLKMMKQVERYSKLEIKLAELKVDRSPGFALPSPLNSN